MEVHPDDLADEEWGPAKEKGKKGKKSKGKKSAKEDDDEGVPEESTRELIFVLFLFYGLIRLFSRAQSGRTC